MSRVPDPIGTALVRPPGPRLAEGIVTHIARRPVDVAAAREQHAGYVAALAANGWRTHAVPAADEHPDAVFVEDTVIVVDDLAVLTRPGAPARRGEVTAVEVEVRALGLRTAAIQPPAILDGGDVLQVGRTVYVGLGDRTDAQAVRQLSELLAPLARTVVTVPLAGVLHLKSAVTALPDGSLLGLPDLLEDAPPPGIRVPPEEAGAHVVPLGGDAVLIAASAPRTAELVTELGFRPVPVEIEAFATLADCVTCLSVLVPDR
jgi:dimethylargininase